MTGGTGPARIAVRPADPADFPAIGRLTIAAYVADGQLPDPGQGYGVVLADVAGRADDGDLLVAVDGSPGGAVLGTVIYLYPGSRFTEVSGPGEAEFRMLAVDPAAQGRGVGRALAMACVERAEATGCAALVICVRDFALPAQKLYASLGFVRTPALDWSPEPDIRLWGLRLDLPRR